jgi:hypothetical protein
MTRKPTKKKTTKKRAAKEVAEALNPDPLADPDVEFVLDANGEPYVLIGKLDGYKTRVIAIWDQHFGDWEVLAKGITPQDSLKVRGIIARMILEQQRAHEQAAAEVRRLQLIIQEQQEIIKNGSGKRVSREGPAKKKSKAAAKGNRAPKKANRRTRKS